MSNAAATQSAPRATVYRLSSLGWVRAEQSDVRVSFRAWAQFQSAVVVQGRTGRAAVKAHVFTDSPIVVLEGWGHFAPAAPGGESIEAWREGNGAGFDAALAAAVAGGARVVCDLREHNARRAIAA